MTAPDVIEAVAARLDLRKPLPGSDEVRAWKSLIAQAQGCTSCRLSEVRKNVVFGDGNKNADLVIVGDAPGRTEDLLGKPFVGAAGNLLDNLLLDAGISRAEVYVTSLVKCHPAGTTPQRLDVETCMGEHLREELALLRPKVIVALGPVVTSVLMGRPAPLERVAGFRFDIFDGVTLIPTEHPATVIKGKHAAIGTLRRDLLTARAVMDGRLPAPGKAATR